MAQVIRYATVVFMMVCTFFGLARSADHTIYGTLVNYNGDTLSYVEVILKSGDQAWTYDEGQTDANGYYSMTAEDPATPRYLLKFRAINDAAKVHPTINADPRVMVTDAFDFVGDEERNIAVTSDDSTDGDAFWLAGQVYRIRQWFHDETGLWPDRVPVEWPAGAGRNKAYYWGVGEGIHVGRNKITSIYHEYGHFLMDQYAGWIDIPYYGGEAGAHRHWCCAAMDGTIWPYLEGFAHYIGALSYVDIHGSRYANTSYQTESDQDWIEDPSDLIGAIVLSNLGDSLYTCGEDYKDYPLYTESAVGAILYDLVDFTVSSDTSDAGLLDQAQLSFAEVWLAFTNEIAGGYQNPQYVEDVDNPFGVPPEQWFPDYSYPMTLMHFWDSYRDIHSGEPVPYLWSAFARNYLDWDSLLPGPPALQAASHDEGVWKNDGHVYIRYDNGEDDVSGVYYYETILDTNFNTDLYPNPVATDTTGEVPFIVFDEYRSSGVYYIHLTGQDFSGKWDGLTTTYGPIQVDVDSPCVNQYAPVGGEMFFVSDEIEISWEAVDDHSGIASVRIEFEDYGTVPNIELTLADHQPAAGTLMWVIPDTIGPTGNAIIRVTAKDSVGLPSHFCDLSPGIFEIGQILVPSWGDYTLPPVGPGDLAWADFDGDGRDDLAYLGKGPSGPNARIMRSQIYELYPDTTYHLYLFHMLDGVEDGALAWADFDGDGRLDLVTMGRDTSQATRAHFYFQTSPGVFTHQPSSLSVAGAIDGDMATADLDADGDMDLVVVGRWIGATAGVIFKGYEWDSSNGLFTVHDLDPMGLERGEVLLVDYDGDHDRDIVYAGQNMNGTYKAGGLRNDGGWSFTPQPIPLPLLDNPKMDAGDFTANGLPDIAIIGSGSGSSNTGLVLENLGAGQWAVNPDITLDLYDGDVTFVDIDNDGDLDLTAVGVQNSSAERITQFWVNHSSGYLKRELEPVIPLWGSSLAWGDVEGDHDLDMVIMGRGDGGATMKLYYNQASPGRPNGVPDPPENLSASSNQFTGRVLFSWDPPSSQTDMTPQASLTYDLKVGCAAGLDDIHSGVMPVTNGNTGFGTEHVLFLNPGTYHWTVRTADGGWERSPWAASQTVLVTQIIVVLGDVNGDGGINVLDVVAVINHILGKVPLDKEGQKWADCNGDGALNVLDAMNIINVILGIVRECPGGGCCE